MKWLVVASRAGARVYQQSPKGHLQMLEEKANPLGRLRNRSMQNDKPGVSRGKFKDGTPHNITGGSDPHVDAADQFAREVASYLRDCQLQKKFDSIEIVAEPKFLGMIRSHLSDGDLGEAVEWSNKDLENVPESEWPEVLGFERIPDSADDLAKREAAGIAEGEEEFSFPFKIDFADCEASEAISDKIKVRLTKLEKFADRITHCHVAVRMPHRHHGKQFFHIQIQLEVPGGTIVVDREPEKDYAHTDIKVAIRDAFDKLERQLKDFIRNRNDQHYHGKQKPAKNREETPRDEW